MSKLTDKIEALVDRTFFRSHEAREGFRAKTNAILADVRTLEEREWQAGFDAGIAQAERLEGTYQWTQAAYEAAIVQAKREAYEHVLAMTKDGATADGTVGRIRAAIDALYADDGGGK